MLPPIGPLARQHLLALTKPGGALRLRLEWERLRHGLGDALEAEFAAGHGFLWLVAGFGAGAALYFSLPREPWLPALAAVAIALVIAAVWARHRGGHARGLALAATLIAGLTAAATEARLVAAPRLDRERTVLLTGRITDLESTLRSGLRLTVRVEHMEARGLEPGHVPKLVSATVQARGLAVGVGDRVRFRTRLKPPDGPVLPGGYDFARRAWFDGRGAYGYAMGRVERLERGERPLGPRLLEPVAELRHAIAERIRAALPGASGAIAAAMVVGEQRAIPTVENDWMRNSGLTHIISISGLHMSLVAGGVIAAVRGLLAMVPGLALRRPIKKWAAAAAFFAVTVYLLLSGGAVAALRSYLMLSVALLAVLVERPAITQRTVAVAALAILLVDPASALDPSFLMSFLAVIALVASYDAWRALARPGPGDWREVGLVRYAAVATLRHVEGLAFSSLVAGLATAPVIAATFYRGAPYSIVANMIVLPAIGILVMPAACVALLLMPFGLDPLPLWAMGLGIDYMVAVGRIVSGWPGGEGLIGAVHPATAPIGIVAVLWLSFWRTRLRLLGVVPALACLALAFLGPRPSVLVSAHGTTVAVRGPDGRLIVMADRRDRFEVANWLAADADPRKPTDPGLAGGWRCDPLGCALHLDDLRHATPASPAGARTDTAGARPDTVGSPNGTSDARPYTAGARPDTTAIRTDTTRARAGGTLEHDPPTDHTAEAGAPAPASRSTAAGPAGGDRSHLSEGGDRSRGTVVALVRDARAFAEDCRRATIVVTPLVAPPGCADHATVVDRLVLARTGALALDLGADPRRPAFRPSQPSTRPWTPQDTLAERIAAARADEAELTRAEPSVPPDPTAPDEMPPADPARALTPSDDFQPPEP